MNTTSLLLNGRPGASWAIPEPKSPHSTFKTDARPTSPPSPTTTPTSSPSSSPRLRPRHLRRVSSDSTGWYLDADTPSLQDFERRAQTFAKRLEKFISRCATNVVMGLLNPAAVALILFNPALLVLLLMVFVGWVWR